MKEPRYLRNGILEDEEQEILKSKKVAVIGCGGLGGYVVEMLARLGVGHLVLCDGDRFDETNLNRQLLAKEDNLGISKVLEAAKRVLEINSHVRMTVHDEKFTDGNGRMARLWHSAILAKWQPIFEFIPIESQIEKFQSGYYDAISKECFALDDVQP